MKASRKKSSRKKSTTVDLDTLREIALAFPGTEESTSYGTPSFKVKKKLFARLHQDDESVVVKIDFQDREVWMEEDPDTFFITDHYLNYPMMQVRLSRVKPAEIAELLEEAWRRAAPRGLIKEFDAK